MSLFTQKHYEFLEQELRKELLGEPPSETDRFVDALCRVFELDNPRFKRGLFTDNVTKEESSRDQTKAARARATRS